MRIAILCAAGSLAVLPVLAQPQGGADLSDDFHGVNPTPDWQNTKCDLYERAWGYVIDGNGANMSVSFVEANDSFITSRCTDTSKICPENDSDIAAADMLALMVASEGMTTSFLPFSCNKP